MSQQSKGRRRFIGTLVKGSLYATVVPAFSPALLAACSSTWLLPDLDGNDLKKLQESLANKQQPLKWIFTGDSITQGAKHTLGYRAYPEIFAERVRFEMGRYRDMVINSAVSGHSTKEILADFDWRVGQFKPDVVSLMIGTNDAAKVRGIAMEEFGNNLETLVKMIRALGAIPVLHTPNTINMGEHPVQNERAVLPGFTEKIRQVATDTNCILVDHWTYWQNHEDKVMKEGWRNDPLHPNGRGHLEMARLLFQTLDICDQSSFTCTGEPYFS